MQLHYIFAINLISYDLENKNLGHDHKRDDTPQNYRLLELSMAEKLFPTQSEGGYTRGSETKKASRDENKKDAKIMDGKTRYWVSSHRKVYCRVLWFRGPATNDRRREIPLGKSRDAICYSRS